MDYYSIPRIGWFSELENTMITSPSTTGENMHYLVIGLGDTGLSCVRFLSKQGLSVSVMDTREAPPALQTLQREFPDIAIALGGLDFSVMMQCTTLVLSPGIDPRAAEIKEVREKGIEVVGDIELFSRYANAPVVAITGSNGKSTVTTLLADMAAAAGKHVAVGGNLGLPALDLLTGPTPDFYILELSSFQLETVSSLNAHVSVVLNLSPDHLDRYDSEADYQTAKARIYEGDGVMLLNADDSAVCSLAIPDRNTVYFSLAEVTGNDFGLILHEGQHWLAKGEHALLAVSDLPMVGSHNIENALAALALGTAMDLEMAAMLEALRVYSGLPHRCRLVAEAAGVRWINDSKATNVGACLAAITGLASGGPIVLIAGGVGKDQDFSVLTSSLAESVRGVVLMGEDAPLIATVVPAMVTQQRAENMLEAVKVAQQLSHVGDSVLLSPACASFDMFANYIERGTAFENAVQTILAEVA